MRSAHSLRLGSAWLYAAAAVCSAWPTVVLFADPTPKSEGTAVQWEPDGTVTIAPGRYRLADLIFTLAATAGTEIVHAELLGDQEADIALTRCPLERFWVRVLSGWSFSIDWEQDTRDPRRWRPVRVRIGDSGTGERADDGLAPIYPSVDPEVEDLAERIVACTNVVEATAAALALARAPDPDAADALMRSLQHLPPGRTRDALMNLAARELTATNAVPILVGYARGATEPDVRETALRALARLATPSELERWMESASSDASAVIATVWLEVVRRASNPALEPLLRDWCQTHSKPWELERASAALQGLAALGTEGSVRFLLEQADRGAEPIRMAAADALGAVPPTAQTHLLFREALSNPSTHSDATRSRILDALARAPDSIAVECIRMAAREDPSPLIRKRAKRLCEELGISSE